MRGKKAKAARRLAKLLAPRYVPERQGIEGERLADGLTRKEREMKRSCAGLSVQEIRSRIEEVEHGR